MPNFDLWLYLNTTESINGEKWANLKQKELRPKIARSSIQAKSIMDLRERVAVRDPLF